MSDFDYVVLRMRPAQPVNEEPKVQLTTWRMIEVDEGVRFLAAILPSGSVRTTSALKGLDPVTRRATTSTGRQYELLCGPTEDAFSLLQIKTALSHAGFHTTTDVSDAVWMQIVGTTH